jgi:hypothetical protein
MPLTPCSACGRQISTEAASCPQCGHPQGATATVPPGAKCYACAAPATRRCERCRAPGCDEHLQGIRVGVGEPKRYEVLCQSCCSAAKSAEKSAEEASKACLPWIAAFFFFGVIGALILRLGFEFGWFSR